MSKSILVLVLLPMFIGCSTASPSTSSYYLAQYGTGAVFVMTASCTKVTDRSITHSLSSTRNFPMAVQAEPTSVVQMQNTALELRTTVTPDVNRLPTTEFALLSDQSGQDNTPGAAFTDALTVTRMKDRKAWTEALNESCLGSSKMGKTNYVRLIQGE